MPNDGRISHHMVKSTEDGPAVDVPNRGAQGSLCEGRGDDSCDTVLCVLLLQDVGAWLA